MAMVFVEFTLGSRVLVDAASRSNDTTVVVEQVVGLRPERVKVLLAATDGDLEAFEAGLEADETVVAVRRLEGGDVRRYRARFAAPARPAALYRIFVHLDAILVEATVAACGWEVRSRFPDRESFVAFRDQCRRLDVPLSVQKLSHGEDPLPDVAVTEPQREALLAAYEAGYFDVPRSVTMEDIADRLGVSAQAVSARLRRGHANLVRNVLGDADSGPTSDLDN